MKLVYSGNLGRSYDLATVCAAVEQNEDFELDIAGFGETELPCLSDSPSGRSRIRFHGLLKEGDLHALYDRCDVGIIPMQDDSWVGIPNKMFDYSAAGLPIVSSLNGESAALLRRYRCGVVYKAGDVDSFAAAVCEAMTLERGASRRMCEREFDAKRIYGDYVRKVLAVFALMPVLAFGAPYEIASEMESESFWKNDPVLFVKRHADAGFEFTSDQRTGADSRLDGGVVCHGVPVYESKISFGLSGGIERVELLLFATAGTETFQQETDASGKTFRRRVRLDRPVTKAEFGSILSRIRAALTEPGHPQPKPVKEKVSDTTVRQMSQTWAKTSISTQATLVWNYTQVGRNDATFRPGFIRLSVNGPSRLAEVRCGSRNSRAAKPSKKIADNVIRDPRGDVFIDNVPMVDQGQKGYCSVATAERVLRYYGVEIDEHELAQSARTDAEVGTSTLAMKQSVEAMGRRHRLGAIVCYGDFEKGVEERIAGLNDEVRAYNKAAKKLKKPTIADSVYIRQEGAMIYYNPRAVDEAMDPEVLKEMKVNGMQKSKYTRFMKDIREQVAKGVPLFWGVTLGIYPEPGLQQANGGHMRLIIGYNDRRGEVLYSDSWGAGHELKRMPADWAWAISHCLFYLKPR